MVVRLLLTILAIFGDIVKENPIAQVVEGKGDANRNLHAARR